MPVVTGVNSLDFLKGTLPRLQVGAWKTNGGTPDGGLLDFGYLRGIAPDFSRDVKIFSADNVTWDIDAYLTGSHVSIKGELLESNLMRFAQAFGHAPAAVLVTVGDDYPAIFPLDEPEVFPYYWQVVLSVAGQSFVPTFNAGHTAYTSRIVTLWRCIFEGKIAQAWKKDGEILVPFVIHAFVDTSITAPTYGSSTNGRIGKITDQVAAYAG